MRCSYNAAINYEKAHLPESAIAALERLLRVAPSSPLAKSGLCYLGKIAEAVADYEKAARAYEDYARRYPGDRDRSFTDGSRYSAPTGLQTAIYIRSQLGQVAQANADVELFIKNYGARRDFAEQAAALFLGLGHTYEEQNDAKKLREHLGAYLRQWAARGSVDRQIVAEVKLGQSLWQSSCATLDATGLCVPPQPNRGVAAPMTISVQGRKPPQVREAMAHFQTALDLYRSGIPKLESHSEPMRAATAKAMAAKAMLAQADAEYEALLAMQSPAGASRLALTQWMEQRQRKVGKVLQSYEKLAVLADPQGAVAAAARTGQLQLHVANATCATAAPRIAPATPGGCIAAGAGPPLTAAAEDGRLALPTGQVSVR